MGVRGDRGLDAARRLLMGARKEALVNVPWRVGRSVGRTIYAVPGEAAVAGDVLIGVMDSSALAAAAVRDHNEALERR